ncbi:MAG: hypothetical protein AABX38_06770 [Candidatus Micrarchaeota archaeon]
MTPLISGLVYKHKDIPDSNKLSRELRIFPTPFKGIYYVPYETERAGWYITNPHLVIFKAARLYLGNENYYFGLYSALYYLRTIWNAQGINIINEKLSRTITRKSPSNKYWRGKIINKIMQGYPFPIRFHRIKDFDRKNLTQKGPITYSDKERTKKDANYLCKKGDKLACEIVRLLEKAKK